MNSFNRYIFRQIIGVLILILTSLTVITWPATALKQLKLITAKGQDFGMFFKITMLAMPSMMGFIAPIAFLIACLYTLNRMNSDSELIVVTASGSPVWSYAKPFMLLGAMVSVLVVVVNLQLQPQSLRALKTYILSIRSDIITQVLQPGKFKSLTQGMTFHIKARDPESGDILGLIAHDARNRNQIMSYLAERARIIKRKDEVYLVMLNGHINRKTKDNTSAQIIAFDKYVFDLANLAERKSKTYFKPRYLYLHELLQPDPQDPHFRSRPGKFRAELHERFSSALYPLLFAMIALAMLGNVRTTREGRINSVITAFLLAIGARVLGMLSINLAAKYQWAVPLAYAVPIGGMLLAIWAIRTGAKPHYRPAISIWTDIISRKKSTPAEH